MSDKVCKMGNSLIHYGKENSRIYLMKLDTKDMPHILQDLEEMAKQKGYGKIIAKVPAYLKEDFEDCSYIEEAVIPDFYNGEEAGYFMSKFMSKSRTVTPDLLHNKIIKLALKKSESTKKIPSLKGGICRIATIEDIDDMIAVYKKVFKTYPFPIYDKKYIEKTMKDNVVYFGIWIKDKLVSVASCEIYEESSNAEMTDFATLVKYRGHNFSGYLLREMEQYLRSIRIDTAYTIARAESYGMNITFAKADYDYSGTLVNNTNIAGKIESMNVWYKPLQVEDGVNDDDELYWAMECK